MNFSGATVNDVRKNNNLQINNHKTNSYNNITNINECSNNKKNDKKSDEDIENENSTDSVCELPLSFLPRSSFRFINCRALESREIMMEIGESIGGGRVEGESEKGGTD